MRILLVDDDKLPVCGVESALHRECFIVDRAKDCLTARAALHTTQYVLLLLDLGTAIMSGASLLTWLRTCDNHIPVLVLGTSDAVADRVSVLEAGADDYLGKPFDPAELIARCRAILRRSQGRSSNLIRCKDLTMNTALHTMTCKGTEVQLTRHEWAVMLELLTHQGMPQSRSKLEESLYGWHSEIESNAIEVHVSNLRKKLGPTLIRTLRGIGYVVGRS
ncbi:response regulator [Paraburkholderia sediminicola]|uniref:response regulator n=1 Tax=Paraburkholderia sediminicola TaxID=458836 RepID=UPI0038B9FD63